MTKCLRKECKYRGVYWPILCFTPKGGLEPGQLPYRLEIPALVCQRDVQYFNPHDYLNQEAKDAITKEIVDAGRAAPDWRILSIDWRPMSDPVFQELKITGEARLAW